jgi:hypothetical protein
MPNWSGDSSGDSGSKPSGGGQPQASSAGGSNWQGATAFGIAEAFTTPYAGGDWETNWTSTMSPEQREFYKQLLAAAGKGSASQAGQASAIAAQVPGAPITAAKGKAIDPESLSIMGLDSYNTSNAIKSYETFLDTQANKESMQAQVDLAKQVANEAIGGVSTNFAGKGLSSSASSRAAGKVQTDLGTNIAKIYTDALNESENRRLAATQGLGSLESTYAAQELQRLMANQEVGRDAALANQSTETSLALADQATARDMFLNTQNVNKDISIANQLTQNQVNMLNAQLGTQYSIAEMQYMLGLINAQTGENISTQGDSELLHSDIWGGNLNPAQGIKSLFG